MPRRIRVTLTETQRQELVKARNSHTKPYVRERAAAILKVADGTPVSHVAEHGLLKRREPETVAGWIRRYEQEGLKGLEVRPGAGRKPAFSPSKQGRSRKRG
jgi:transposase